MQDEVDLFVFPLAVRPTGCSSTLGGGCVSFKMMSSIIIMTKLKMVLVTAYLWRIAGILIRIINTKRWHF